jgi:hypothetical protein
MVTETGSEKAMDSDSVKEMARDSDSEKEKDSGWD